MAGRTNLAPLDAVEPYDVCVVGSGPAGTLLGSSLAQRGARVLMLESGRGLIDWLTDRRIRSLARYDFTGDTDYPRSRTTSRLLGGNSNFWTGRCERFHPSDFEPHPYTPPENPWPIGYADLDPVLRPGRAAAPGARRPEDRLLAAAEGAAAVAAQAPTSRSSSSLGRELGVEFEESATATPTKTLRIFNSAEGDPAGLLRLGAERAGDRRDGDAAARRARAAASPERKSRHSTGRRRSRGRGSSWSPAAASSPRGCSSCRHRSSSPTAWATRTTWWAGGSTSTRT